MSTLIVDGPRWLWMWVVAITIYALLKALSWHDRRVPTAPAWRHWAYLLAWPGMNANRFLKTPSTEIDRPGWREWAFAFAKMILGISLLCAAVFSLTEVEPYLRGWVGMLGLVFSLHFGLFHLLSCVWRTAGVSAPPLMNWPIASESLAEFWGRRWNLAFRDLAYRFLFVPLQ